MKVSHFCTYSPTLEQISFCCMCEVVPNNDIIELAGLKDIQIAAEKHEIQLTFNIDQNARKHILFAFGNEIELNPLSLRQLKILKQGQHSSNFKIQISFVIEAKLSKRN